MPQVAEQTDQALLSEYAESRGESPFAELVRRYAGMVYGTGLRVTGNPEDAADITQECFMSLAHNARALRQSIAGWLHVTARSRAINRMRDDAARRRRERHAAEQRADDASGWPAISAHVDEAIAELPEKLREPVVRHYLRGQTQAQVGAALRLSQPTVSRRLEQALAALRQRLSDLGAAAPAIAMLDELLVRNGSVEVPPNLAEQLTRIAAADPVAATDASAAAPRALIAIAIVLVLAIGAVIWLALRNPRSGSINGAATMTTPASTPNPATALAAAPDAMELQLPAIQRRTWIEGFAAPGALRPLMQAIGDDSGFSATGDWYSSEIFPLFIGVCGDAFRFVWYRKDGQPMQQSDRFAVAPPARQFLPALDAAGFDAQLCFDPVLAQAPSALPWDATTIQRQIVSSISQRHWPVLVVDLPEPGWNAIITGYANGGETLIGYSEPGWESFGFRFEPAEKRKFANWFHQAGGIVLLTGRRPRPPESQVLRAALDRAVPELRRREVAHLYAGPATYEILAQRLADPALSATDEQTASKRDALLFPCVWDLATQRHYASGFLKRAAEVFPAAADELNAASGEFTAIHDAVWEINRLGGGKDPGSPLPKLADPQLRQRVAQMILECRDRDLRAADAIERALGKLRPTTAATQ